MNIGIVTTWFERGAAYVSRQYRTILEKEHRVFIYARGGGSASRGGSTKWDDEAVTRGGRPKIPIPTSIDLNHFRGWIRDNALDIVFFNEQHWWPPVGVCTDMGVVSGAYIDYYTEETIPAFEAYDFLICNTKRHFDAFRWHPQAHYVPWGTDTGLFRPRSFEPVAEGVVTFFHSAGYSPTRKGTDLLLAAFAELETSARLVIHSQVDLTHRLPKMADLIGRLTDRGTLQCIHREVEAPGLYHMGDIYVYPSRLDGIGLTVAEALSCGLPVITTDAEPMNQFVTDDTGKPVRVAHVHARGDGYYWPCTVADVPHLTETMRSYCEQGTSPLPALKKKAREHALNRLDWNKNADSLLDIFARAEPIDASAKQRGRECATQIEFNRPDRLARLALESPLLYRLTRRALRSLGKKYF